MDKGKILIVEDEKSMNDVLTMLLEEEGHHVSSAFNGKEGLDKIRKDIFDIVVTDIKMPNADGFAVLKSVKELSPDTIVIMITAFGSSEMAVQAMKQGAYDYINKPFKIDEIRVIIKNAFEKRKLSREVKNLKSQIKETYRLDNIIGKSPKMVELLSSLLKVADTNANVLITGESGSGKELLARAIHNLSKRAEKEFIAINCAALPEGLLESELFGHMKGTFTGASYNKEGLFEVADEGTIFLDEIGEMPLQLQAKLLRVLESSTFRRIGGTKDIKVNVRVVSATNKNLKQEAEENRFRQDLYYRLNVIPLHIPPLRERKEDIPLLADYFLEKSGNREKRFSPEAMEVFMNYQWSGNVRELYNTVERIITFTEGLIITNDDLPMDMKIYNDNSCPVELTGEGVDLDEILSAIEKQYLQKALDLAKSVKTDAAKLLNISFRQFRHRLNKYGLG